MKNDQRPQGCAGEHDSSMSSLKPNCALLQWAALQNHLSPHLQGVLLRLVSLMGDDGSLSLSQTAIAPLIKMGERQTRAAIKELVSEGLIKRTRQGAVGRGRAPDRLSANVDNGDTPPLSVNSHNGDTGEQSPPPHEICDNGHIGGPSPVSVQICDNGDNAAMSPVSLILDAEFVDNLPAPYKGTGARADKLTLNTLSTEIYSETAESVSESVREVVMAGGGPFREEWVLGTNERTFAHSQGLLNGSVDRTFAMFGAHHMAKGTITVNWRGEWKKWVLRQAHDPRFKTNNEAMNDQRSDRPANEGDYTRRKRSRHIDALFADESDGPPKHLGRLDFSSGK